MSDEIDQKAKEWAAYDLLERKAAWAEKARIIMEEHDFVYCSRHWMEKKMQCLAEYPEAK